MPLDCLALMLVQQAGAHLDAVDAEGRAPFTLALRRGHADFAGALVRLAVAENEARAESP